MFLGFTSDNASAAHPRILEAMIRANQGYCKPYGEDEYSVEAVEQFRKLLGPDAEVFFSLCGTGANVLALRAMLRPWEAVICADVSHINTDESGAPEWATGSKLLPAPSEGGKIRPESIDCYLPARHSFHHSTPKVLSLTQSTEMGTVYTQEEVRALADKAHRSGLYVHMDGSRIANAVAALEKDGVTLKSLTRDSGVDVLSFGGAKNGLALAEAVIFFRPELAEDFRTMRKQSLQLVSKMRFVAAQFTEALKDGLWLDNARHANDMAAKFAGMLSAIPCMKVIPPQANAVFVQMEPKHIAMLQEEFHFLEFDPSRHMVRLMCSFATTDAELEVFVSAASKLTSR